ncbi:MAG: 3-hydroxyacyl-(acyl-carrier-protein) dehydratase FabZ [candidate division WS2 bacterium]|nr:3-hydroxyacyl-(acyl-carrier-protein) dehydratase FabZ [Candidatus Lithacetigena glycinireducens]
MILGIKEIKELIPHRFPILLVDKMLEIEEGKGGVGVKCVTYNESFFQGHFPQEPIMPGVLIIECIAQVAAIVLSFSQTGNNDAGTLKKPKYLLTVEKVKFKKPVVPGDTMLIEVMILKRFGEFVRIKGEVKANNEIVALGELTIGGSKVEVQR